MKYLIANWKMNHTVSESMQFIKEFLALNPPLHEVKTILAPSFTSLYPLSQMILKDSIQLSLCAQNICEYKKGAYTGEVSGEMIQELGCQYVLLGHSERRHIYLETNTSVYKKFKIATEFSLIPIVCFGETFSIYKDGKTKIYIDEQLAGFKNEEPPILAYEPVWSIGTGLIPSIEEISTVVDFVKMKFPTSHILYGGSVNPGTVQEISKISQLDGFLVGGASLKATTFYDLLTSLAKLPHV